ncbi:MAG: histidinol dehydrogenase [Phycisphaeraceae bacterium]|nr:histidinol dehydrogenase [Phycisphaeraceae bacterium]
MTAPLLNLIAPADIRLSRKDPLDADTLAIASRILTDVRERGLDAVASHAIRLGDVTSADEIIVPPSRARAALDRIDNADRRVLESAADRIRAFALAQRTSITDLSIPSPIGGSMGHKIAPVERAGCYAPGGRYPLPSSVLMTAITARAAGVREVWLASPRPSDATLAAAAIAGVDGLIAIGGAQAIGAFAYGAGPVPRCDAIAGPGNRFVTAAKQLVSGRVAIDMLAGPSELLIIADETADPATIAADLLAQAEHDPDAIPMLVTTDAALPARVNAELSRQLETLPTAVIARASLSNGFVCLVDSIDDAIAASDEIAPEHLEIITRDADALAPRCSNYGAIFIGSAAAEVFGDYGVGPNHTLPTGGTARSFAGLSVFTFLKARTFLQSAASIPSPLLVADIARFARLEGLEAHARAAESRL